VLIVPNEHIANTEALEPKHDQVVGAVVRAAREVARLDGLSERGYRTVINTGPDASNSVGHLHVHVLGGRQMSWPPG
jgi:histidine triad (HIT) family protein